jgi:predicted permease
MKMGSRGAVLLATLMQDFRHAFRIVRKSPVLVAVVTITLGLGIGANTTIFSVLNGFLLRPLPVRAPEEIMVLATEQKDAPLGSYFFSYLDLQDFKKQAGGQFSDIFGYEANFAGLSADNKAEEVAINYVTGNYFSALGVKPLLGRLILPSEGEMMSDDRPLVLGYSYWEKRFGGDPSILGKQVHVDGRPATIVGVAPKEFEGLVFAAEMDCYLPLNKGTTLQADSPGGSAQNRGARHIRALGRLQRGTNLAQAQQAVTVIGERLAEQYPVTNKGIKFHVIPERLSRPVPLGTNIILVIAILFLLLAGLVLLLACLNVANILAARAMVLRREMAVRAALGAGRFRLIRLVLIESIFLAVVGGAVGVVLGWLASSWLSAIHPVGNVRLNFSFDWKVFAYSLAAAVFTGIVVGLWPALRSSRTDLNSVLREGGRSDSAGGFGQRIRSFLVVAQVGGSLTVLIVAGLFVRSLAGMQRMSLGFDPDNVVNAVLDPHQIGYDAQRTKDFYRELQTRIGKLPGLQSVSFAFSYPMSGYFDTANFYVEGQPVPAGQQPPTVLYNSVGPGYFENMRIPLLQGRAPVEADDETMPSVALVNQTMAARFWPNQSPLGKRFSLSASTGPFVRVIGVVPDGKYTFMGETPQPYFYLPLAQNFRSKRVLQVRSLIRPEYLRTQVRREIQSLDPGLPISDLQTMREALGGPGGFFIFRMGAILAGAMGVLGMILAVVGVYGVVSFTASQRTQEIGIRMALGANRANVLVLILRQGCTLILFGILAGLILAWTVSRGMASLFVGVSATDPLTFSVVTLLLTAVAFWACYIPARRATGVQPTIALRGE